MLCHCCTQFKQHSILHQQQTIEEFATRVGQQAVVLVATPGKPNTSYRVFGAKPLEDVVRNLRCMIMEELENALAQQVSRFQYNMRWFCMFLGLLFCSCIAAG